MHHLKKTGGLARLRWDIPRPAWWWAAALLEALALLLLLVAVKAALGDGLEFDVGEWRVRSSNPWRPFLLAVACVALRYRAMPPPGLFERAAVWSAAMLRSHYSTVLGAWAFSRAAVLLAGALAVLIGAPSQEFNYQISSDPVANLPARWDAGWYMGIALHGYRYEQHDGEQSVVFFPAYPMLVRLVGKLTTPPHLPGMDTRGWERWRDVRLTWTAAALSALLFLAALFVVYRWTEIRAGPETAGAAAALLAAYPFSVYYSAPYTESLFLLGAAGACLAFERQNWTLAVLAGLATGLTRPNGLMLSVVLALLAGSTLWRKPVGTPRRLWVWLAVTAPVIGFAVYVALMVRLTDDPLVFLKVQRAWGRSFEDTMGYWAWFWRTLREQDLLFFLRTAPVEFLQSGAAVFALVMVPIIWKRIGVAYAVFVLVNLLPPLLQGGVLSIGRFTSTLFPLFAALAMVVPARRLNEWLIVFAVGQGLVAALFYTWRPVF